MTHKTPAHATSGRRIYSYWLAPAALVLLILALAAQRGVWAAPQHQTVPPAPTSTPTPRPQATNTPRPDDDDDAEPPPPVATATQPQEQGLTGQVIADRLNLRSGPGTSFAALGVLLRGQTVRILARNETGEWWRVCCLGDTTTEGWSSAQFIQPNFDRAQANTLIPLEGSTAAPTQTPISTGATPTATVAAAAVTTPTLSLELVISQSPAYVWQGQEFALEFAVTNLGNAAATNVELRNELPPVFTFVSANVDDPGVFSEEIIDQQRFAFSVVWPVLEAGEVVSATVNLQVAADVPDGVVIDNLAVVDADNAAPYTAGISIGMPPTSPPDFQ